MFGQPQGKVEQCCLPDQTNRDVILECTITVAQEHGVLWWHTQRWRCGGVVHKAPDHTRLNLWSIVARYLCSSLNLCLIQKGFCHKRIFRCIVYCTLQRIQEQIVTPLFFFLMVVAVGCNCEFQQNECCQWGH